MIGVSDHETCEVQPTALRIGDQLVRKDIRLTFETATVHRDGDEARLFSLPNLENEIAKRLGDLILDPPSVRPENADPFRSTLSPLERTADVLGRLLFATPNHLTTPLLGQH